MKREITSILIVAALIIGAGIGYYGNTRGSRTTTVTATFTANNTKTETVVSNYTVTTTMPSVNNSVGVDVMECALTIYDIIGGNSTGSISPQLYNTTTSLSQIVGFATTTTNSSNVTLSGTVEEWTVTACTVVSAPS